MFKFSNIKKLFSYNWGEVFKKGVPKGNSSLMQDEEFKDIRNGAIVRILAVAFAKIAAIGIAVYTVVKAYGWLYGNDIMSYAISNALTDNIGKWIGEIIGAAVIPILILIYVCVMKNKKQNGWPIFIILIYSLLQTLYALYSCIGWVVAMPISPIFAILGLVSVFLVFLGNVHMSVGCADFCLHASSEVVGNTSNTVGNYQPNINAGVNQNINMQPSAQPIGNMQQPVYSQQSNPTMVNNLNDGNNSHVNNMQNNTKFCTQCGNKVNIDATFCTQCGNRF